MCDNDRESISYLVSLVVIILLLTLAEINKADCAQTAACYITKV